MKIRMTRASLPLFCLFCLVQIQAQTVNLEKYSHQPQSIQKIRIASASVLPDKWDKQGNWSRIEKMVRQAVQDGGAGLVVTPEGALDGYVINEVNEEKDESKRTALSKKFFELGEPMDGPYIHKACRLSRELGIYLVFGFLERRDKNLFNTAILIDPEGDIIGKYSKTHFAQGYSINPDFYKAGNEYPVFDTPFGKVGILICYDRQLPEPARILALKGAQVLLIPAYGSYTGPDGWNTILLRTRAIENKIPLVFCNPFQSLLITHRGDLKEIGSSGEIVSFEIDTDPERDQNKFRNRRPPTYDQLLKGRDPIKFD